jgi:long-chain acyl-CoA synthetase
MSGSNKNIDWEKEWEKPPKDYLPDIDIDKMTFPKLLLKAYKKFGKSKVALREKEFGIWQTYTWADYYEHVKYFALGLKALGFETGDKISIISDNRPEWVYGELAAQCLRGCGIGIYQDSIVKEVAYIIDHSDSKFVIAEDQEQVDKMLEIKDDFPKVQKIIYHDPKGMWKYKDPILMPFWEVEELGRKYEKEHNVNFEKLIEETDPFDVAQICTTSGTTGFPKLAMLTHHNLLTMSYNLGIVDRKYESDEFVSFLPLAWVGEQMMCIASALLFNFTINFPEEVETTNENIREIGPNLMFSPPRVWENLAATVQVKILDASPIKRWFFNKFLPVGYRWADYKFQKKTPPLSEKIKYWLAYVLVFRALKDRLGFSKMRSATTGGAALGPDTFRFFHALGIELKQIYGQTEIAGISCIHRDGDIDFDSVGKPIPDTHIKITEDGEIISKSPSVFVGYYKNEKATKETVIDGWLYSGDAGYFNDRGHLVVIDRVKDVMTLKDGTKFSPQFIENKLKFSPYIKEAVCIGHEKDYIVGMICIDYEIVGKWAETQRIEYTTYTNLSANDKVQEFIEKEVVKVNEGLPEASKIKKFVLLYKELHADDDELTRTGKVRRKFVEERYVRVIKGMYNNEEIIPIEDTIKFQDGKTTTIKTQLKVRTYKGE